MIEYKTIITCDKCRKEVESIIRFRILSKNVDKQVEDKDEKESLHIEYCKECFNSFMDNLP